MMTLDQVVALPGAARALLVAHRWICNQQHARTDAFELLHGIVKIGVPDTEAWAIVDMIANDGERAHAALAVLHATLMLDRSAALAKSLGVEVALDEAMLQRMNGLIRRGGLDGGAQ